MSIQCTRTERTEAVAALPDWARGSVPKDAAVYYLGRDAAQRVRVEWWSPKGPSSGGITTWASAKRGGLTGGMPSQPPSYRSPVRAEAQRPRHKRWGIADDAEIKAVSGCARSDGAIIEVNPGADYGAPERAGLLAQYLADARKGAVLPLDALELANMAGVDSYAVRTGAVYGVGMGEHYITTRRKNSYRAHEGHWGYRPESLCVTPCDVVLPRGIEPWFRALSLVGLVELRVSKLGAWARYDDGCERFQTHFASGLVDGQWADMVGW